MGFLQSTNHTARPASILCVHSDPLHPSKGEALRAVGVRQGGTVYCSVTPQVGSLIKTTPPPPYNHSTCERSTANSNNSNSNNGHIMKLYAHPQSPPCRTVTLALDLYGVDYEYVYMDLFAGAGRTPEYLKVFLNSNSSWDQNFDRESSCPRKRKLE